MRKSRFSDEQIIAILKEHDAGEPTADLCRKHDISPASFYKYKAKFGGMDVSDHRALARCGELCRAQSIGNLTTADVYFGRGQTILLNRARIKRQTFETRRLQRNTKNEPFNQPNP